MPAQIIEPSILHELPKDIETVLLNDEELLKKWNNLTPIARNEWICWVTIPKKQETRDDHIERLKVELIEGKKTPCCWPGCPHRRPKAAKWFKSKVS
jgi:uncharacterized protein YdeI (YjbR/CyaY-like superfamily)